MKLFFGRSSTLCSQSRAVERCEVKPQVVGLQRLARRMPWSSHASAQSARVEKPIQRGEGGRWSGQVRRVVGGDCRDRTRRMDTRCARGSAAVCLARTAIFPPSPFVGPVSHRVQVGRSMESFRGRALHPTREGETTSAPTAEGNRISHESQNQGRSRGGAALMDPVWRWRRHRGAKPHWIGEMTSPLWQLLVCWCFV